MATIVRAADLALVGSNAGAWVAPLGTAQPTDPAETPSGLWLPLGAISEDGLTNGVDEDSEPCTPWGLTSPRRTVTPSAVRTLSCPPWEPNRPILKSLQHERDVADLPADADRVGTPAERDV